MMLKINNVLILFVLIFAVAFIYHCDDKTINFDFSGRKVLYSNEFEGKRELVLLNIDTKDEIKFDNFEEIERSSFLLFNDGKSIFVNSYSSSGKVFVYDVLKNDKKEIDIHEKNEEMSGLTDVNIFDKNFYFASANKIYAHSLSDFNLVKAYTADSLILQFSVYNQDLMAVVHQNFNIDTKSLMISNIYLYDFKNKTIRESPFRAYLCGWSQDRKKLLFNSGGPKIMYYPSLEVQPIDIIDKDSLKSYIEMQFISNNEIVFSGYKKGKDYESTNLYLLNIETNKIEQITNTYSMKEIKSTDY